MANPLASLEKGVAQVEKLRAEVTELRQTLDTTNERLAALANPSFLQPLHQINKLVSIALFGAVQGPLGKVFNKIMG
jgi:hypothetical protein